MPLKKVLRGSAAKVRTEVSRKRVATVSAEEKKILSGLRSRNALERSTSVGRLGKFGGKYEAIVVAAMKDPEPGVVENAVQALMKINPKKHAPLIASKILDSDKVISTQAIAGSGAIRNRAAIPLLRKAALDKSRSAHARAMAVAVLYRDFGERDGAILRAAKELRKKHVYVDISFVK